LEASASAGLRVERRSRFSLRRFRLALARVRSNILVRSLASPDAGASAPILVRIFAARARVDSGRPDSSCLCVLSLVSVPVVGSVP
jgi:hypothetical protein